MRSLTGTVRTSAAAGLVGAALTVVGVSAVAAGAAGTAHAAHATVAELECRSSVTHIVDRPDNGQHGVWALRTFTRTVQICPVAGQSDFAQDWNYHATVTDSGGFTTVEGRSPQAGVALAAGVPGTVVGGFTADFTAPARFVTYNGKHHDKTYAGVAGGDNPSTGTWVASLFDGGITGTGVNDDWSWTYRTCAESWVNAATGGVGDITGSPHCPDGGATPPAETPPANGLPSTGIDAGGIVLAGGAALMVGVVLLVLGARRRLDPHI